MTRREIIELIEGIARKYEGQDDWPIERRDEALPEPEAADWDALEARFGCRFPKAFKDYVHVMCAYFAPGHLEVFDRNDPRANETIAGAYDREMGFGLWNPDLVPFDDAYSDYYCLLASAGDRSPVYYVRHGLPPEEAVEQVAASFEEWLGDIELHLGGELAGVAPEDVPQPALDRETRQRLGQASLVWRQWFPDLFKK